MVEKQVREVIEKVYALNDEVGEDTDIYAFPFDQVIFEAIVSKMSDYSTEVFMPNGDDADSEDGICPYAILRGRNDAGGYMVYVFATEYETERLFDAVRKVMVGESLD